jgi:hypothetical protein
VTAPTSRVALGVTDRAVESEHRAIDMVGIADTIVGVDCQVPSAALPGSIRGAFSGLLRQEV